MRVDAQASSDDIDIAIRELEWGMEHGAKVVNLPVEPTSVGKSPFDPMYDPIWARIDEAGLRVAIHLHGRARHEGMKEWGEDAATPYPRYDAFQWTLWWSDRPIMEMVGAMIFHNLFGRFPNVRVLIAEYGAVWLPYMLRKMDHAFALGPVRDSNDPRAFTHASCTASSASASSPPSQRAKR